MFQHFRTELLKSALLIMTKYVHGFKFLLVSISGLNSCVNFTDLKQRRNSQCGCSLKSGKRQCFSPLLEYFAKCLRGAGLVKISQEIRKLLGTEKMNLYPQVSGSHTTKTQEALLPWSLQKESYELVTNRRKTVKSASVKLQLTGMQVGNC